MTAPHAPTPATRGRAIVPEDDRLAAEALKLKYVVAAQVDEARRTQQKFAMLGLERRTLGEILLQRGDLSRVALRDLYRRISPDVDLPAIEGYEVRAKIGEGGMGAVYEALQRPSGRVVALKVLHPTLAADEVYLKRFVREARTQAMLDHPNIVACLDVGVSGALHYFVMEYVEGQTVKELLRERERFDERAAFEIATQVARALECAHRHGLVHRDIKPENVLVAAGNQAKLCDLGLARPEGGSQDALTETGSTHGTPFYMSPEQAMGEPIDIRSDIYALGATLYEMVTGARPFGGRTAAEVLVRQISEPPRPPRELVPSVSEAAEEVILAMLAKQAKDRPADPRALAVELARIARGRDRTSGVSRRATAITVGPRPARRALGSGWSIAALAAYGALATLVAVVGLRDDRLASLPEIALPRGFPALPTVPGPAAETEARARAAFEDALRFERARAAELGPGHPSRTAAAAEVAARYREVVARYAADQAYWAYQARDRLAALDAAAEKVRRGELDALRDRLRVLLRQQRWRAAAIAVELFDWPASWAAERRSLDAEVEDAAAARQAGVIEEATRLAQGQDPLGAIGVVERFCAARPPVELGPALSLLELLRRDLAVSAARTLEAHRASRDERLHAAFRALRPLAASGRLDTAAAQLGQQAAAEPDPIHGRALRWLGALTGRGAEVFRAAGEALAVAAPGRPRVALAMAGRTVEGVLIRADAQAAVIDADGHEVSVPLAELARDTLLEWARRAAAPPDAVALAGYELAVGTGLAGAHRLLAAVDHPWVELVERLRHHEAALALARYHQLRAQGDDGPRMMDCLDELVDVHGDLAILAGDLAQLVAQRSQLRERDSERRVEPHGKRTAAPGAAGWSLRYAFRDDAELGDWELGEGWTRGRAALEAVPAAPGVLRYRYAVRPDGAVVQLTVFLGTAGEPGFAVDWRQGDRTLRLELVRVSDVTGELVLRWMGDDERALARVPVERADHGQYNLKLWLERESVSVELDGRPRLQAQLTRPLEVGRLELVARACPITLRSFGLSARLLAPEEHTR